jgi:hypothetical protein
VTCAFKAALHLRGRRAHLGEHRLRVPRDELVQHRAPGSQCPVFGRIPDMIVSGVWPDLGQPAGSRTPAGQRSGAELVVAVASARRFASQH